MDANISEVKRGNTHKPFGRSLTLLFPLPEILCRFRARKNPLKRVSGATKVRFWFFLSRLDEEVPKPDRTGVERQRARRERNRGTLRSQTRLEVAEPNFADTIFRANSWEEAEVCCSNVQLSFQKIELLVVVAPASRPAVARTSPSAPARLNQMQSSFTQLADISTCSIKAAVQTIPIEKNADFRIGGNPPV